MSPALPGLPLVLPGLSPALPGAPRLVIDRQALCKRLQHNCSRCEECNSRVILMKHIRHHQVKEVRMQRDPSPGWRVACNSLSERAKFRQGRQSRPEHPGVSDGNYGRCWWLAMVVVYRLESGSCLVDFLCSDRFIWDINYYTCQEVFRSLRVYFIDHIQGHPACSVFGTPGV